MAEDKPYNFFKVFVPHNTFTIKTSDNEFIIEFDVKGYKKFLETSIFPVIDQLLSDGLIDNYHFLNHKSDEVDLRISIPNEEDKSKVENTLKEFGITGDLEEEGRGRPRVESDILRLNTEITRLLLHNDLLKGSIHYLSNQNLISNLLESNTYVDMAVFHREEHHKLNNNMSEKDALRQTKTDIRAILDKYVNIDDL